MKLCKIFSTDNNKFHNIIFNKGFNVIIGEITDKKKSDKDTHNLGKTLLISLIDFLLLKGISKKENFFLTRGSFEGLIFYLELELFNNNFLIIKRGVDNPSKISFCHNKEELIDCNFNNDFEHKDIPLDKAKEILNTYLNFNLLKNWDYRKSINYFLRTQNDFRDVFKLDKFKGKDKDWKPFMFELLGFSEKPIREKYEFEELRANYQNKIDTLETEADINIGEKDKIQGLLDIKIESKDKVQKEIDNFNFYIKDKEINNKIVEDLDFRIQTLNTERYNINFEIQKIKLSLQNKQESIDIEKLKQLYNDVKLYFPDDLINNFESLLNFNQSISEERNKILEENYSQLTNELEFIEKELYRLESEKAKLLSLITEKDLYIKFKTYQIELSKTEAEIIRLNDKLTAIDKSKHWIDEIKLLDDKINLVVKEISNLIGEQKHSEIRKIFNSIIETILNTNAIISINLNKNENIEFQANIQNPKDMNITSEDFGTTYRKLLCMAFDISILIYYSKQSFYKFIYHDGALEALDDRKKIKYLNFVKEMCDKHNLQYIITLIDSDLPTDSEGKIINFSQNEICLTLNDKEDNSGRLFKKSF